MNKQICLLFSLFAAPCLANAQTTLEFASPTYSNGDLVGQDGWTKGYGLSPALEVDVAGSGSLNQVSPFSAGAAKRTFSTAELGEAFSGSTSKVTYEFNFTYTGVGQTSSNSIAFGIGDGFSGGELDVGFVLRPNGTLKVEDGYLTGTDRILGAAAFVLGSSVTVTLEIDYKNNTYSISRSDTGDEFSLYPFDKGASADGDFLRIDSNTESDFSINSVSVSSVTSTNSVYFVSPSGNPSNEGSYGSPFDTIQKAADLMVAGDTAIIREGVYRETVTLANSGTAAAPITLRAYPGESALVTGLDTVDTAWTLHATNIYKTTLDSLPVRSIVEKHEDQVFLVDHSVSPRSVTYYWEARWPNLTEYTFQYLKDDVYIAEEITNFPEGWTDEQKEEKISKTLKYSGLSGQADDYWKDGTLWFVSGQGGWLGRTSNILESSGDEIVLEHLSSQDPVEGVDFYISGLFSELDAAKEWFIDDNTGELFVYSTSTPAHVEIKKRVKGIVLDDRDYIHVEGIELLAANIQLNNSNHCVIDGVTAEYVYGSDKSINYTAANQFERAINVVGDYNTIQNSSLSYSTGSMIQLEGVGNQVVNNHLFYVTILANYAGGIHLNAGDSHKISHNTINDIGRSAISSMRQSTRSIIQYNHIYDYMWLSADGGAIYFWGMDMENTEIRYNVLHSGRGLTNGYGHTEAHAIYLDSQSSYVMVHHNLVYDVGNYSNDALRLNRPAVYRLIYNNTFIVEEDSNNPGKTGCSVSWHWNKKYFGDLFGCVMINNIMTGDYGATNDLWFEDNIAYDTGLDFVDPANGDYRLQSTSLARDVGLSDSTMTDSGVLDGSPDVGAYEYGGTDWDAGHDFTNPPTPDFTRVTCKHMNLLGDGGFDYLDSWDIVNGAIVEAAALTTPTGALSRGARLQLKMSGPVNSRIEQVVTGLKPDTTYRLSGWVFCEAGESVRIGVKNYGITGVVNVSTLNNTQYDNRQDIEFTTANGATSATVFIRKMTDAAGDGSGELYADDFSLEEVHTDWFSTDVGTGQQAGQAILDDQIGTIEVTGSGVLGGTSDQCHFAYRNVYGDADVWARFGDGPGDGDGDGDDDEFDALSNDAKAGVMIRKTAFPSAKFVALYHTKGGNIALEYRDVAGGASTIEIIQTGQEDYTWLVLRREGDVFSVYKEDQKSRTLGNYEPLLDSSSNPVSVTVSMPQDAVAGVFVSSNDASETATAKLKTVIVAD